MTRNQIKSLLASNPRAVERAILALYHCQTVDEQHTSTTTESNGRGFNCFDAEYGSYLGRWLLSGRHLTGSHLGRARALALRYVGQLVRMANTRAVPRTSPPITVTLVRGESMSHMLRQYDRFQQFPRQGGWL